MFKAFMLSIGFLIGVLGTTYALKAYGSEDNLAPYIQVDEKTQEVKMIVVKVPKPDVVVCLGVHTLSGVDKGICYRVLERTTDATKESYTLSTFKITITDTLVNGKKTPSGTNLRKKSL